MTWNTAGRIWRSGAWSLELRDDELADIAFEDRIALRSLRAVVRDRNWDTARLAIDGIEEGEGELRLRVHTEGLGADLAGTLLVVADGSRLTAFLDLLVRHGFWTNRTGLVVLHPAGLAGEPVRVRHSDGRHEESLFPADISPHQPVLDIAELDWSHAGLDVSVRFGGDVFEMEDQRNWTDASFKTYSRPLDLPFPYELGAGSHVKQWVEVRGRHARRRAPASSSSRDGAAVVALEASGTFPEIAVGASTAPDPAPRVDAVGTTVLVELDLATPTWRAALDRATTAGLPLDVRFIPAEDDPVAIVHGVRALHGLDVVRVTAFAPGGDAAHVSDAASIASLRAALAEAGVTAPVVGGARSHFTELNRERHRLPRDLDGITFSVTPLFHSPSTAQLVESLAIQRIVATQAVGHADGTPVHIGPVTLRPRFNNVATTPPPLPEHPDLRDGYGPQLLDADDERQDADELAAWTIASAAALAVPGVASVAFFEEWGPRGLRRADGTDRPVAEAVRALTGVSGTTLLRGDSPDGFVWALGGASDDGTQTILVANLDRVPRTIEVRTPRGPLSVAVPAGGWTRRRGALTTR